MNKNLLNNLEIIEMTSILGISVFYQDSAA